jgi:hypothetical protein
MKHIKKFENYSQEELEIGNNFDSNEFDERDETVFEIDFDDEDDSENDFEEEVMEKRGVSYKKSGLKRPEKSDLNKDGEIESFEKAKRKSIDKSMIDRIKKRAQEAMYRKSLRSKPQD